MRSDPRRTWKRLALRLVLAAGAAGLFVVGYQWGNRWQAEHGEPPAIQGVLVRPPGAIPGFTLKDPSGRIFDGPALGDGWTLMAFGDLSKAQGQLAVQRLLDVYNRVADQDALRRRLRLALVTTADTPDLARGFAQLSPALYILSGETSEVGRLSASLGAQDRTPDSFFVFSPGGYLVAVLPEDEDGAAAAADLVSLYKGLPRLIPSGS